MPNLQELEASLNNIAEDGTVLKVSGGTGMGYNKEHYKNILVAPMAYGQSLTILALSEALLHIKTKPNINLQSALRNPILFVIRTYLQSLLFC